MLGGACMGGWQWRGSRLRGCRGGRHILYRQAGRRGSSWGWQWSGGGSSMRVWLARHYSIPELSSTSSCNLAGSSHQGLLLPCHAGAQRSWWPYQPHALQWPPRQTKPQRCGLLALKGSGWQPVGGRPRQQRLTGASGQRPPLPAVARPMQWLLLRAGPAGQSGLQPDQ